jgi:tRNA (cytosine34-C5)-methyltransferase
MMMGGDGGDDVRLRWHATFEAARSAGMPHATPTLWPPDEATAGAMNLERCSRLLPHDQDTGGFFVALLRKRAPLQGAGGAAAAEATSGSSASRRPATGPASCRELPALPPEQKMVPLTVAEADATGDRLGVVVPRRRLLRAPASTAVHVAPRAITAFAPGALSVVSAGLDTGKWC